ncbi:MAG TPA: VOC family protein [Actinomycetota bacterium]|nr:VOC family protein [Actinomycetota bacterium]
MSETQAFERDRYPAGVPCWIDIARRDPDAAADFYGGLFGWRFEEQSPPGSARSLIARLRGRAVAGIGSEMSEGLSSPAWMTYIATDDADETARRVSEVGGRVLVDPVDVGDAGRSVVCSDPSGATFSIWQAGRRTGAQLVNEPGTWNFSELNTNDRDGAEAFYGAVFGWELSGFGDEGSGSGLWRMPGYGDFLAERDPTLWERQADLGAPEGFADAVAWLLPSSEERSDGEAPAHWSITFAVDDADAIAGRATELGGKVLVPPMDAPWVRMTVITDPHGAVFTASKFVPPT